MNIYFPVGETTARHNHHHLGNAPPFNLPSVLLVTQTAPPPSRQSLPSISRWAKWFMSGEARDRPVNPTFVKLAFPTQVCELMFFYLFIRLLFLTTNPRSAPALLFTGCSLGCGNQSLCYSHRPTMPPAFGQKTEGPLKTARRHYLLF